MKKSSIIDAMDRLAQVNDNFFVVSSITGVEATGKDALENARRAVNQALNGYHRRFNTLPEFIITQHEKAGGYTFWAGPAPIEPKRFNG